MPNIGKPSRACHLCRKRRVECDLTLPGCLRCAKVKKHCPGYRIEQDLLFYNQDVDSIVLKSARPRRKKRVEVTVGPEENCDFSVSVTDKEFPVLEYAFCGTSRAQLAANADCPKMPLQIPEHWNEHSIPIVLQQFFAPSKSDPSAGYPNFVPDLYKENSTENSCLRLATMAVAKAYFSHLACGLRSDKELVQIYGRALRATNFALEHPTERVEDSTILAVWLLGIFELIVNSPNKPPMPTPAAYSIHCRGLTSLLHSRGQRQFSTQRGRSLFLMIFTYVIVNNITGNTEGPPQSLAWLSALEPHLATEDKFPFAICSFLYRVSLLYPQIIKVYTTSSKAISHDEKEQRKLVMETKASLATVDALQSDIHTWRNEFASQSFVLDTMHLDNLLRGAQLKLQFLVSLLIAYLASSSASSLSYHLDLPVLHQQCYSMIHSLSLDILSRIPPALGDPIQSSSIAENPKCGGGCGVNAGQLLFPIMVVCRIPVVSEEQREKALRILQRIGANMGIRFALDYASNYKIIMLKPLKPLVVD